MRVTHKPTEAVFVDDVKKMVVGGGWIRRMIWPKALKVKTVISIQSLCHYQKM